MLLKLSTDVWSQFNGSGFKRGSHFSRKLLDINPSEFKLRKILTKWKEKNVRFRDIFCPHHILHLTFMVKVKYNILINRNHKVLFADNFSFLTLITITQYWNCNQIWCPTQSLNLKFPVFQIYSLLCLFEQ